MATATDNLNPPPAPNRVFYSLGRMLGVEDFQADQDYHRAALARALLQLCGTGTVAGLNVLIPQVYAKGNAYIPGAFVFDTNQNVQVNTGTVGIASGAGNFSATLGASELDSPVPVVVWTNFGRLTTAAATPNTPPTANVWKANTQFTAPMAITDANNNVQVLTAASPFTSGADAPAWKTTIGEVTDDGDPSGPAWTCVGTAQLYAARRSYPEWTFVFDTYRNVQVNTGAPGAVSGIVNFNPTPGKSAPDGIQWTNYGSLTTGSPPVQNVWKPNSPFASPIAIVDSNSNVQVLTAALPFTSGGSTPVWNTSIGGTTQDGNPALVAAWTCVGPSQLEIAVSAGLAIDRVGRMIESSTTVCILLEPWLADQAATDLADAMQGGSKILVDVFATFAPCNQGVTPCFGSDDYDATDAFSANRLLDSFSMQLVLRNDTSPGMPQDPWIGAGAAGTAGPGLASLPGLQQDILLNGMGAGSVSPFAVNGPTPPEYPPGFDVSSVFLARISIPATVVAGSATYNLNDPSAITIDNLARLFVYPPSLVARTIGFSSGTES
jgi:hypothetical protein